MLGLYWGAPHRPASLPIAQLQDQRKSPETAIGDINGLLNRESYKSEAKGPGATPHCEQQTAGRTVSNLHHSGEKEAPSYRGN